MLALPVAAEKVVLVTEGFPPYNYLDASGRVTGFSTELVRELCKTTDDCMDIALLPWNRAYAMAQSLPYHALFSVYRRPEREGAFKWACPLAKAKVVFFARKGSPITINSLDEARKVKRIGVQKNSAHHLYLENLGFKNLDLTASADKEIGNGNLKMLLAGRFDLWMATELSAYEKARKMGVPADGIRPVFTVFTEDLCIAFNLQTPDEVIARWQAALDDIRKKPVYGQLAEQYLN